MLPSNLFAAKIRKGSVRPNYLTLDNASIALAKEIVGIYDQGVGNKRSFLNEKLGALEGRAAFDFKTVWGLVAILERRCTFMVDSKIEPMGARMAVFEEASKRRVATALQREQLLAEMSEKMNLTSKELEDSLFKDLEDEQVLSNFNLVEAELLIKAYNLSLAQTALFKSVNMEFTSSGNWKRIFRDIKRFGLMYTVERKTDGTGEYSVNLDGPLSLFKMTERYGTSLAKLLPTIVSGETWSFRAELIERKQNNRILHFEETSAGAPSFARLFAEWEEPKFDSSVEERFASKFNSLDSGWTLRREPEPLNAGRHVLIPDFSFEKYGMKLYLEIVGFWTNEYLERKLSKLSSLASDVNIIVAVNETLRCSESKLSSVNAALLLTYSRDVPLEPIVSHLKSLEQQVEETQVKLLRSDGFKFAGESVSLQQIADERKVSLAILKRSLSDVALNGYRIVGDYLLSEPKVAKIRKELGGKELTLSEAVNIIISLSVAANPEEVLRSLGYSIEWNGLDYERSRVKANPLENI